MLKCFRLTVLSFLFLIIFPLSAQVANSDDLSVKIALFSPGNKYYAWWGHAVLIIDDTHDGRNAMENIDWNIELSTAYDFGIYSNGNSFKNIAAGKLIYTSEAMPSIFTIHGFISHNCGVTLYTLDISPEKREVIRLLAENSVLSENRDYYYRFFDDNCATRIRDIINIATDGQFKEKFANENSRLTCRQDVSRHIESPVIDWLFNFFMGQNSDRRITAWEAMFLPSELANSINNFAYTDENGNLRKLVSDTEIFFQPQNGFSAPDKPRNQTKQGINISRIVVSFLIFLFLIQSKFPTVGRIALGVIYSLFGLLFGTAGLLLFYLTFFTSYDFVYHNANLLFINPLLLVTIPFSIKYAISSNYEKRQSVEKLLCIPWFFVFIGAIVSMLIKLLPMFWQKNFPYELLMMVIAVLFPLGPFAFDKITKWISRR